MLISGILDSFSTVTILMHFKHIYYTFAFLLEVVNYILGLLCAGLQMSFLALIWSIWSDPVIERYLQNIRRHFGIVVRN